MSSGVPYVELSNGHKMPMLGLGTAMSAPGQVEPAISAAFRAGYTYIDTAFIYANEEAIGNILEEQFRSGTVKREDIFLSTKLPPTHNRKEDIEPKLREELRNLKVDYVDMYLVHMPAAFHHDGTQDHSVRVEDIWEGMEEVYEKGLTKAIGVSNFNATQIRRILKMARVRPHNVQVETHINLIQTEIHDLCKAENITMTGYAPLGSPGRGSTAMPKGHTDPWPPGPKPLLNPLVLKLAGKYIKPPAAILLRYLHQRGIIVVPKSVCPERILENIQIFDFELLPEEVQELSRTEPQQRFFQQNQLIGHPEDPFANER
ncbi:aldo/keto reductase family domain-containing protein [Ditylenchus destructor]|nr:aldo/keto reductase family domain-containing protein [Ditylenchus destructor]